MTKNFVAIFFISFALRIFISFFVWHPDVNNHIDWGIRFWEYGPAKFFEPESNIWNFTWPNQPPGTIYLFAGVRKLFETVFAFFWWINVSVPAFPSGIITFFESNLYPALLKLPAILADFGIAYLIYKFITSYQSPVTSHQKKLALLGATLFLVNPVIWYNSAVWGQTDAVVNFLGLLSFYLLLFKKNLAFSILALSISLYIKASLLIFLPIYAIVVLRQKFKAREVVFAVVGSLLTVVVLTLPFSLSAQTGQGEPFAWLFNLYKDKVFTQQLQVITANAFNLWAGLTGIHEQPHTLPFLGLTYQYWGYILFGLSFVPILYSVYKRQDAKTVIWALALTAFSSWMLLTNMHERYLYPLFPYLTILVSLHLVSLYPYILVSMLSLLNMYNFWWVPRVDLLVNFFSFGDRLMPRIFGFLNFGFFLFLFKRFLYLTFRRS